MSVKIMGVNYDDLAKLMGADLIVAGDAVVAEVVAGKEFYAGSTTLLTGILALTGDANVGDVLDGLFFYKDDPAVRLEGTMPTVAIIAASNAYPAGHHVGNVGGLDAIDLDLVTANIKNGITIFNVVGDVDVRDVSDANSVLADVKAGKTFYAVGGARKTGNLATVAIVAANDNYPAGYHAGNVGGLDAVDPDLAVGNIKAGATIFGFAGNVVPLVISDYRYHEFLASGASYTPTAHALSTLGVEDGAIGTNAINVEFFDGVGWINTVGVVYTTLWNNVYGMLPLNQDNDQSLRIKNDAGFALDINLTGIIWSLTDYHYYATADALYVEDVIELLRDVDASNRRV